VRSGRPLLRIADEVVTSPLVGAGGKPIHRGALVTGLALGGVAQLLVEVRTPRVDSMIRPAHEDLPLVGGHEALARPARDGREVDTEERSRGPEGEADTFADGVSRAVGRSGTRELLSRCLW